MLVCWCDSNIFSIYWDYSHINSGMLLQFLSGPLNLLSAITYDCISSQYIDIYVW